MEALRQSGLLWERSGAEGKTAIREEQGRERHSRQEERMARGVERRMDAYGEQVCNYKKEIGSMRGEMT